MKRRRLIALVSACTLVGLGLVAVVATEVLMRTDVARSFIEDRLGAAVNGNVLVGRISGNPFSGITIDTIAIRDKTGELFFSTGRVAADYDVRDLMDTRLFLRHVVANHPYLHLRQYANGDWNFRRIFKGTNVGPKAARAADRSWDDYVVLDSVRALNGTFILSLSWSPDDSLRGRMRDSVIAHELARTDRDIAKTADGYAHTYTWTHANALLPHVRLMDRDSSKFGQLIQIASLDVDESDPPFRFQNVRGSIRHLADSVWLSLSHWDLPASTGSATGKIVWGGSLPIRYDLAIRGDSVALNDVNWVYPTLPKIGGGKMLLSINNKRDVHVMDYKLGQLDMRSTGSHLTGEMTFGVGAPVLQVRDVDLTASPIDFEFIKTLNGKPFPIDWRGQIYGSVRATGGPLTDFEVDAAHGEWRDGHVPGAVSRFSGSGGLDILNPLYTAFHDFRVDIGSLDLRSIEYLFPAFPKLGGTIAGRATLDSVWTDVRFHDADVLHRDGPGKPSRLTGVGRITDGEKYITYDVALIVDSLSFETLARSYPGLPLRGMAYGPMTIRGQTPTLDVATRLSGPAGQFAYNGKLDVDSVGGYSARGRGDFANVNLAQLLTKPSAPLSSLSGEYDLDVEGANAVSLLGLASVKLGPSKLDSAVLDSSNAIVRFANGTATITDTVRVKGPMGTFEASGSIGLPGGGDQVDTIRVSLIVDSVGSLRPFLGSAHGKADSLSGNLKVTGYAIGRLDSLLLMGDISGDSLFVRGLDAPKLTGKFTIFDALHAPHGTIDATAHQLTAGGLQFDSLRAVMDLADTAHGSFKVHGAGQSVANLGISAGGSWAKASGTTAVHLDSLALSMADSKWQLDQPAILTNSKALFAIDSIALRDSRGGSLSIVGVVPRTDPIDLRVSAFRFPVTDLNRLISPVPAPIAGLMDFSMTVGGTQEDLKLDASASVDSIRIVDTRIGKLMSTAHYENQRATVGVNITAGTKQVLEASADSLPIDVRIFSFDTLPGQLRATVTADSADFSLVQALVSGVSKVAGKMSGQLSLSGSWSQPQIAGQFALRGASLNVDTLGIFLDSLSGKAIYAHDTLTIDGLRARSGGLKNNYANLTGTIGFQQWAPDAFNLKLTMRDFEAYNRPELAKVVATTPVDSGPIRLVGTMARDSLVGYMDVARSNIFLPDKKLATKQIKEQLGSTFDGDTSRRGPDSTTFFQRVTANLSTDLRVHLGSDVSLSADYADIPLTGDLRIVPVTVFSTTANRGAGEFISRLAPEGTILADRGTYTLDLGPLYRDMTVDKGGTITFDRDADWNPVLNLTTRYTVHPGGGHPDIPVIVDVKGRLIPSPEYTFRTDAPFPISQSDLVSYLITGQPGFDLALQSTDYRNLVASALFPTASSVLTSALRGKLGTGVGLRIDSPNPDIAGASSFSKTFQQTLYSTRLTSEWQVSDKMFVSLSGGFCYANSNYRSSTSQNSFLNQIADPFGGNFEYRLSAASKTGANLQFAVEPSTQALLCSPSSELNLRGAAPTPRQYSLSFLKYWRW